MVLTRFLPQNEQFFAYFRRSAANVQESVRLLVDLVEHYDDVERKCRRIRDVEHEADELTHQIFNALNRTFVTPLDREDIRELAIKLDDVVDAVEEVARRLWLYRIDAVTDRARAFTRIIAEQATIIAQAIPVVEHPNAERDLLPHTVEMNRLENEADDVLDQALATLFDGVTTVPGMVKAIRWGELYEGLEEATDRAEDVANTLEGIVLKNA